MSSDTTVLIASVPDRQLLLYKVLQSLYPQVERVCLSLNGYQQSPRWLDCFSKVQHIIHLVDERRANIVWEWMGSTHGYVFVTDDDILYPSDYVQRMRAALDLHDKKGVMTVHGKWFGPTGSPCLAHFAFPLPCERRVSIAGVGTCCFHTDELAPTPNDFSDPYFRDLQFSLLCQRKSLPIYAIGRKGKWLSGMPTSAPTLCDVTRKNEDLQVRGFQLMEGLRHGK